MILLLLLLLPLLLLLMMMMMMMMTIISVFAADPAPPCRDPGRPYVRAAGRRGQPGQMV